MSNFQRSLQTTITKPWDNSISLWLYVFVFSTSSRRCFSEGGYKEKQKYVERRHRQRRWESYHCLEKPGVHSQDKHTTSRLVRVFRINKWMLHDFFPWLKHTRGTGRRKDEISLLWALKEWWNEAEERKFSSRTKKNCSNGFTKELLNDERV